MGCSPLEAGQRKRRDTLYTPVAARTALKPKEDTPQGRFKANRSTTMDVLKLITFVSLPRRRQDFLYKRLLEIIKTIILLFLLGI